MQRSEVTTVVILSLFGMPWLGLTAAQGSPMRPLDRWPTNFGRGGYALVLPPRPRQLERQYQMGELPLPSIPSRIVLRPQGEDGSLLRPPFGPPAQPQQASPRCPPQDGLRQGTWSAEGGDSPPQSTGVSHGSQGGVNPPPSSFASGQLGPQQGALPASHPGEGSGVILPSSSYGVHDPWASAAGQRPSGSDGMFGPRPGAGGHEEWSPLSSDSSRPGARPFRPSSGGGQHSEYGPGTPTGYDQRPEGGRPPVELLGTGASGSRPTGDLGYPSPNSGIYGFDLPDGHRPPFYTPRTPTEDRAPEAMVQGPG